MAVLAGFIKAISGFTPLDEYSIDSLNKALKSVEDSRVIDALINTLMVGDELIQDLHDIATNFDSRYCSSSFSSSIIGGVNIIDANTIEINDITTRIKVSEQYTKDALAEVRKAVRGSKLAKQRNNKYGVTTTKVSTKAYQMGGMQEIVASFSFRVEI